MKLHLKEDHYASPPENNTGIFIVQKSDCLGLEFTSAINNIRLQVNEQAVEAVSNLRIGFFNTSAVEVLTALTEFVNTQYIHSKKGK